MKNILIILVFLFSCNNEHKEQKISENAFFDVINKKNVQNILVSYGLEMKKEFELKIVQIAVFVVKKDKDIISIQYIKIDSLQENQLKMLKYCVNKNNILMFYLSDNKNIKPSKSDCMTRTFADKSTTIQDYYPKEILLSQDSILSNEIINLEKASWISNVKIEKKKFDPPSKRK